LGRRKINEGKEQLQWRREKKGKDLDYATAQTKRGKLERKAGAHLEVNFLIVREGGGTKGK